MRMKITTVLKFAVIAVTAVTFSMGMLSCDDDNDDNNGGTSTTLLVPEKIISSHGNTEEVTTILYDNELKITDINIEKNKKITSHKFTYDNSGNIIKIIQKTAISSSEYIYEFTYENNKVLISSYSANKNDLTSPIKYAYNIDSKKFVTKIEPISASIDKVSLEYDKNGKLTKRTESYINDNTYQMTYIHLYNDIPGICKNINMQKWFAVFLTYNILDDAFLWDKCTSSVKSESKSGETDINTHSYTLNEVGYPSVMNWGWEHDGDPGKHTITYKEIKK